MKIGLKELRETNVNLKMIQASQMFKNMHQLEKNLSECNELISIFVASIKTAKKNMQKKETQ